ncbi:hypothetical protein F2P81_016406 [Scophthalmus maximus]|uniref:Uncharacterized protein n=1 Tax=Scophthalmus maximus TaxID=52904 RepID=A0A6A4SL33_SCOMX|nr:hypothetical protein F2P81_016406 [Scophthalmus maximus]
MKPPCRGDIGHEATEADERRVTVESRSESDHRFILSSADTPVYRKQTCRGAARGHARSPLASLIIICNERVCLHTDAYLWVSEENDNDPTPRFPLVTEKSFLLLPPRRSDKI